jgi:hypothetical protein
VKLASHTHVRISKLIERAYYSHCRKASIEARRHLPDDMKRKHKVRHYHQAKVVTHIIRNAPKRITSIHNGDHSKMFERLPHKGPVSIIAACMHKARIAFDEADSDAIFIHMSTGHGIWSRDWTGGPTAAPPYARIDLPYEAMLELILGSAVITVGERLFRQIVGIPMGFDDSPYMSQSFFDYQDYLFVSEAVANKEWDRAVALDDMHRVADDVLCYNCPDFFKLMETWGRVTPTDGSDPSSAWDFHHTKR